MGEKMNTKAILRMHSKESMASLDRSEVFPFLKDMAAAKRDSAPASQLGSWAACSKLAAMGS